MSSELTRGLMALSCEIDKLVQLLDEAREDMRFDYTRNNDLYKRICEALGKEA